MFLFARSWTSQTILALLVNSEPLPSSWDRVMEVVRCAFYVLPPCFVVGQLLAVRLAVSVSVPKPLRSSVPIAVWTFFLQWLLADVVLAIFLYNATSTFQLSLPLLLEEGGGEGETSNNSWGWNGPFLSFACRMVLAAWGIQLGETFLPLALTGGIACGKSTVSKELSKRKHKFCMVDADKIGHLILLPPWHEDLNQPDSMVGPKDSVYVKILETFGQGQPVNDKHPLLDDNKYIDRAKLGKVVFGKDEERKKLNQITHHRIFICLLKYMAQQLYMKSKETAWVCAEIPLLFESGALRYIFAITICVACAPKQQLERLKARNPELSDKECQQRIDSQMPLEQKLRMADIVIWNTDDSKPDRDGNVTSSPQLEQQLQKVERQLKERARGIMDTSFSQFTLFFAAFIVISVSVRYSLGMM